MFVLVDNGNKTNMIISSVLIKTVTLCLYAKKTKHLAWIAL